jgi:type II secretory pathway component PulK
MPQKLNSGVIRAISPLNPERRRGFFLIEVLILTLILGIIAVPLIYSLNTVLRAFKVSNDFTKSIYLAEMVLFQEIKKFRSVDDEGEFPEPYNDFRWEMKRILIKDSSGLYEVKVRIRDMRRVYAELATFIKER